MATSDSSPLLHAQGLVREELFPIREVSRLTGINPVTLRAWERRYGLIQPTRTDSGHRLYSQADIDEVRSILGWIERGVAVSKVGKILARNHSAEAEPRPVAKQQPAELHQWQQQVRLAVRNFDEQRLDQLYGQIFSGYPQIVVFQEILMPVWQQLLGDRDAIGHTSEWLFLDSFLRARVAQRLQMSRDRQELTVLVAAGPGHNQELELLVAGLLLGSSDIGIRVLALGQPLDELSLICEKVQPHALVLFSNHSPAADFAKRMARLALGLECSLLLAGDAADLAQDSLVDSQVACLGSDGRLMQRRLQRYLARHLDT
ncbi:MerR family transcriptional regulator [Pseudomonas sp. R5(2019)]|uniref:MerR family transcriptional regulator n=1 Tax=Pseudomonas sp. R5(2019) TaxID=2697566 RepID=UPI0014133191|nr:MerR family transcriptional regulator [Pseudomonas sp. R5(2019)]NBA95011.1 MerR family transcriptional regulator [Pseudomonas sp. R5(2019)]